MNKTLMMSRHNLRAPLANNGSVLEQSTPNKWPEWDVPGGQLTTKGGVLEVYMGHYMREWLAEQGMVKSGECPPPYTVYAYANSLQRTVATAQFFITGAFPGCDIPVHHQEKMGTMDPTFNPVITDDSAAFSEQAVAAMEKELSKLQLTDSYQLLEKIVNYKDSPACKEKQQCSLVDGKNTFSAKYQQEPGVSGPLKVGNSLVDAFTLQYYEGFPMDQVAWGEIEAEKRLPGQPVYLTGSGAQCCETAGQLYRQSPCHRSHPCTENHGVSWARLQHSLSVNGAGFQTVSVA